MARERGSVLQRLDDFILFKPKLLYFVVNMVFYGLYLYRAKFIKNYLVLTNKEYGYLAGVMAIVSFAFMTVWSTIADALGRHRLELALLCAALVGIFELFIFVAQIEGHTTRLLISAANLSLFALFSCGLPPLTDYLTLKMLSNRPGFSRDLYGRQRLWGTISYGLTTVVVGSLIHSFGINTLFYFLPFSSAISILVIFWVTPSDDPKSIREVLEGRRAKKEVNNANPADPELQQATPTKRPFLQLMTNPNYMFMLFVVFLIGCGRAVMTTFLSKYQEEVMHIGTKQVGYAAFSGIVMEIVIFFFGPWFIKTFGTYWMLIFAQVSMVLRCWAYVIIPPNKDSVYYVYGVELLKGIAFGLTQLSGVKLASDSAPKELQATAQAIYTSVYSQLPTVFTAFAGGEIYDAYSPNTLFLLTSLISTAALILFILKYFFDGSIRFCGFGIKRQPIPIDQAIDK